MSEHVHYAYRFYSSMGSHLSNCACGISSSFFENGSFEFISVESAMQRTPRPGCGWWSNNPVHVDCAACIAKMPELLKNRWMIAEKEAHSAQREADALHAFYDAAMRKGK